MNITTAAAYVGALTGPAALGWQVYSWRRSGSRVVVTCRNTLPMLPSGPDTWFVAVQARNDGRLATTVESWGFRMHGTGMDIGNLRPQSWSDRTPHRLEPGASASFHLEADEIRRIAREHGVPLSRVKGWVRLGDGKLRESRRPVPII